MFNNEYEGYGHKKYTRRMQQQQQQQYSEAVHVEGEVCGRRRSSQSQREPFVMPASFEPFSQRHSL